MWKVILGVFMAAVVFAATPVPSKAITVTVRTAAQGENG